MKRIGSTASQRHLFLDWLILLVCIAVFAAALLVPLRAWGLTTEEEALHKAYQEGQVIRLHILAEDDSPSAQQTKLLVRDAVLAAFGDELALAGEEDAQTVYALLSAKQEELLAVARNTARQNGFSGSVTAQVGILHLPQKTYGNIVLQEGEYRGLRITLGKGQGQNWWCVLFPRLCLALATDSEETLSTEQQPSLQTMEWHSLEVLRYWPLLSP